MTTWTNIADTVLEPGDPVRSVDMLALRDNPIAMSEGAAGAPLLGMYHIDSGTESSVTELAITGLLSIDRGYLLWFNDLSPATDGANLITQVSTDGGSTWVNAADSYSWVREGVVSAAGGTAELEGNNSDTAMLISRSHGNAAGESGGGFVAYIEPAVAAVNTRILTHIMYSTDSDNVSVLNTGGQRKAAEAHDAIRVLFNTGNIASMRWSLYALRA